MPLTKHDENSILGQLRKIANQLGIPEHGQSAAQIALDIHLILKDLEENEKPLQGEKVETNKREIPIHGYVGYNKKAKLLEDPSVCQCRKVFPIMSLPDTVLSRVFKSLDIKDKKNLRLVNRWFGKKVKILDTTFRTWTIDLNTYSDLEFKEVQETLEKAKIDDIPLNYSINVGVGLLNEELYIEGMLTWILNEWGVYVTGLSIFLEESDKFLVNDFFKFPHLEMLHLERIVHDEEHDERDYNIEVELIKRHADTLTKISVCGYWDWIQIPYEIKLPRIQALKFARCGLSPIKFLTLVCSENVRRIDFDCCYCNGNFPEIKMPKLLHISIEGGTLEPYRFAEQFAEQLITLQIKVLDVYELDKRAKFRNLKYLWIDQKVRPGWKFIKDCSSTLEQLVCTFPSMPKLDFKIPNLTDLYIIDVGFYTWRSIFNAENLEFLFISAARGTSLFYNEFELDESNKKYPNLKTLLLPGCINDSDKLTAKYPSKYYSKMEDAVGLQADFVLTLKQDVNRAMRLRAKEFYPCPDLVPLIHDDSPIR